MISPIDFKNKMSSHGEGLIEEQVGELYDREWGGESTTSFKEVGGDDDIEKVGLEEELLHNISKEEYRKILNDDKSSDEQIEKRLQYLGSFFRNIIRAELQKYVEKNREKIKD